MEQQHVDTIREALKIARVKAKSSFIYGDSEFVAEIDSALKALDTLNDAPVQWQALEGYIHFSLANGELVTVNSDSIDGLPLPDDVRIMQLVQRGDAPAPVQDSTPGIKDCPFCGGSVVTTNFGDDEPCWYIGCNSCDAGMDTGFDSEAEAIAAWNKRTPQQGPTPEVVEALKLAYRKHHLGDDSIGWDELSDTMLNALCESMGDKGFQDWLQRQRAQE